MRAHHELAKSQDASLWTPEYARIRAEHGKGFPARELLAGFCFRAAHRIRNYAKRAQHFRNPLDLVVAQLGIERQAQHLRRTAAR